MNQTSNTSSFTAQHAMLVALAGVIALSTPVASAIEHDLSAAGAQSLTIAGDVGGNGIVADNWVQPAGTGVFKPFLTVKSNANSLYEQAYNTDGFNALYLDGLRPNWNTQLRVGDLASIKIDNVNYFGFLLDANEPGGDKSLISIDNVRIYTSATDTTSLVQNNLANLDALGSLRWAMNDPTTFPGSYNSGTTNKPVYEPLFNIDTWIKLDSAQENVDPDGPSTNSNGGSGNADMILYVPQSAFAGAQATDYVWFYNLNGVHYRTDVNDELGATSGYEEWSAVVGPQTSVPDGGSSVALLGAALAGLAWVARRRK